jgi:RHS repeat-associated protein
MPHGIRQPPPPIRRRNHFGWRIRKIVKTWNGSAYIVASDTRFLYDGWNLVAEFSGFDALASAVAGPVPRTRGSTSSFNLLRSYVWGLDLSGSMQGAGGVGGMLAVNAGTATFLPAYDGNGNVLALADAATGASVAQYEYGPFGEPLRATGPAAAANPFRFSTRYTDAETGVIMYPLRPYSPTLGRFLSRDPIEERGGANLFGMAGNDLIDRVDPLGLRVTVAPPPPQVEIPIPGSGSYVGPYAPDTSSKGAYWGILKDPSEMRPGGPGPINPVIRNPSNNPSWVDDYYEERQREESRKNRPLDFNFRSSPVDTSKACCVAIIGETFDPRVLAAKRLYPKAEVFDIVERNGIPLGWFNTSWIRDVMNRKCLIIDIGYDYDRGTQANPRGMYYQLELQETRFYFLKASHQFPPSSELRGGW